MIPKIRIGFDFDKVFVDYPPFTPGFVIDYFYKKKNHNLSYRIPGKIEQQIRIFSHIALLRPPIKDNLLSLKEIAKNKNIDLYLISSRFSFLKKKTEYWTKKNNIKDYFKKMYFNFLDTQPHIFKDTVIKKERIEKFIDDDLDLLIYLAQKNPRVDFFWLSNGKGHNDSFPNIKKIKNLEEFRSKFL